MQGSVCHAVVGRFGRFSGGGLAALVLLREIDGGRNGFRSFVHHRQAHGGGEALRRLDHLFARRSIAIARVDAVVVRHCRCGNGGRESRRRSWLRITTIPVDHHLAAVLFRLSEHDGVAKHSSR